MSKILEQMPDLCGPAQPSLAPTTDIGMMARFITAANVPPAGNNFEQWKDARFETALDTLSNETDPAIIQASYRAANERLVDDPSHALRQPSRYVRAVAAKRFYC
jgi:hypothetical protein